MAKAAVVALRSPRARPADHARRQRPEAPAQQSQQRGLAFSFALSLPFCLGPSFGLLDDLVDQGEDGRHDARAWIGVEPAFPEVHDVAQQVEDTSPPG
jgi:hypothetical protein